MQKGVGNKRDFDNAEVYLLACSRYIELSPVSEDMVMHLAEYRYKLQVECQRVISVLKVRSNRF